MLYTIDQIDQLTANPDIEKIVITGNSPKEAREKWLEKRRHLGMGSSEIAVMMNESAFQSPYELAQRKLGQIGDQADNEHTYWGRVKEPIIAKEYEIRSDVLVFHPLELLPKDQTYNPDCSHVIYTNKNYPFAFASPDRLVIGHDKFQNIQPALWGLEIKNTGARDNWGTPLPSGLNGKPMACRSDDVPLAYYYQIVWCMMILDLPRWDIAVLMNGNSYKQYAFLRDKEIEKHLYQQAVGWWQKHIVQELAPSFRGTHGEDVILRQRYGANGPQFITPDDSSVDLVHRYQQAVQLQDAQELHVNALKQELKEKIGTAKGMRGEDFRVTWSRFERRNIKWQQIARRLALQYTGVDAIEAAIMEESTEIIPTERFEVREIED